MRVATFNVENLFTRYLFARDADRERADVHGFTSEDLRFRLHDADAKRITADAIEAARADVIALQEVESLDTLKQFRDRFLGGREVWPHAMVIDGNDPRRIDVGVLSRFPIVHVRSWQHLEVGGAPVFDRDCLEIDVRGPDGALTLYVNHFKSMRPPEGAVGSGRALTRSRRAAQAAAVIDIVRERFGEDPSDGAWVVLGDLNDTLDDDPRGRSGIRELVHWPAVEDVLARLPLEQRWTHFFPGNTRLGLAPAYQQLDYLLPSRRLASRSPGPPTVVRVGLPTRAARYAGQRLPGVGHDRPKASDHCAVVFDVRL